MKGHIPIKGRVCLHGKCRPKKRREHGRDRFVQSPIRNHHSTNQAYQRSRNGHHVRNRAFIEIDKRCNRHQGDKCCKGNELMLHRGCRYCRKADRHERTVGTIAIKQHQTERSSQLNQEWPDPIKPSENLGFLATAFEPSKNGHAAPKSSIGNAFGGCQPWADGSWEIREGVDCEIEKRPQKEQAEDKQADFYSVHFYLAAQLRKSFHDSLRTQDTIVAAI